MDSKNRPSDVAAKVGNIRVLKMEIVVSDGDP